VKSERRKMKDGMAKVNGERRKEKAEFTPPTKAA